MDLHLNRRVVVVTGGSDGLGRALAERLVEEGARVAVCGRDQQRLDDTLARLTQSGGDAIAVRADVRKNDDLVGMVGAVIDRWGAIDGLVNNAGKSAGGSFETVPDEMWVEDIELKVLAAARLTRLVLPHLRASGNAAIVNVLNIGAKAPGAGSLPTTASRAAGLAITKALAKELGPDNIRVNAILIGLVESGQWVRRAAETNTDLSDLYAEFGRSGIPLGRVGRADEFADLAAYLLSDRSSYVTGSAINLDGGSSPAL